MATQVDNAFTYVGNELDLFELAVHWKSYWKLHVQPFLKGNVLEVGSGIGSNTSHLRSQDQSSWLCLEPDASLSSRAQTALRSLPLPVEHQVGTIDSITPAKLFDCILYMDVLEHIADDKAELEKAAKHLSPKGNLIILSPAHQALYSEFDTAVGHVRRYNKKTLRSALPSTLEVKKLIYLDSVGLAASCGNRFLLKKSIPSRANILTWDGILVRLSRIIDPWLGYRLGKSILCVLSKPSK